jgi:hypothetical protein
MGDLTYLLSQLVDVKGRMQIPGIYDKVAPLTDAERRLYDPIDFDLVGRHSFVTLLMYTLQHGYGKQIGASKLLHDNKADLLMHRWRHPHCSIHGTF